jgi:hypothetical protein
MKEILNKCEQLIANMKEISNKHEELMDELMGNLGNDAYFEKHNDIEVGKKDDYKDNKPMWHLLDLNMLEGVVRLLMFGLEKYGVRDSWKYLENGEDRWYSACIRHLNAHQSGEELDSESKQMHLDAAILNLIFLRYHYLKNKKNDKNK